MASIPTAVAVDRDGNIFVTDSGTNSISVLSKDMQLQRTINNTLADGTPSPNRTHLKNPRGLALDADGNIFVANWNGDNVLKFPAGGGPVIPLAMTVDRFQPQVLHTPSGIAVDAKGLIFVAEYVRHRVQVLDKDGKHVRVFGEGGLKFPCGVALDSQGNVYVADWGNSRVAVFDMHGNYKARTARGAVKRPRAVALDVKGNVYVADQAANVVAVFSPTLEPIAKLSSQDGMVSPIGVAVDSSGNVIVLDDVEESVHVFSHHAVRPEAALVDMIMQSIDRLYQQPDMALLIARECARPARFPLPPLGQPPLGNQAAANPAPGDQAPANPYLTAAGPTIFVWS